MENNENTLEFDDGQIALNNLINQCNESKIPSFQLSLEILHHLKEYQIIKPELSKTHLLSLLQNYSNKFSQLEIEDLKEELYMAAIETSDLTLINDLLNHFEKKFGTNSIRVQKLKGIKLEFQGLYDQAIYLYDALLKQDECNTHTMKRRLMIFKQKMILSNYSNNTCQQFISQLISYCHLFPSDEQALLTLAQTYFTLNQLQLAALTIEELIMVTPENYSYHLLYAETLFAMGQYEKSQYHYIQSLELKSDCLRTLSGLIVCVQKIVSNNKSSNLQNLQTLYNWCIERLIYLYNVRSPQNLDRVLASLNLKIDTQLQSDLDKHKKAESSDSEQTHLAEG